MNKNAHFIILIILFGFIQCNYKGDFCTTIEKTPDGSDKQVKCYINDNYYVIINIDEKGEVLDSIFVDSDTICRVVTFDDKGIRCETLFSDNQPNGLRKCYYKNEKLFSIGHFYDNMQIGEWKFFYPDGAIKSYEYFGASGQRLFLRKYNIDGNVEKSMGSAIAHIAFIGDTVLTDNEVYEATVFLVTPPDCKVYLELVRLNENNEISKRTKAIVENGLSFVKFSSKEKKKHKLGYLWKLSDMNNKQIDSGLYKFDILVK